MCGASRVRFSALLGSIGVEAELTREDYFVTTPCCPHGKWELERTWCTMLRSRGVAPRRLAALPRLGRGRNPERELPKSYDLCNKHKSLAIAIGEVTYNRDHRELASLIDCRCLASARCV